MLYIGYNIFKQQVSFSATLLGKGDCSQTPSVMILANDWHTKTPISGAITPCLYLTRLAFSLCVSHLQVYTTGGLFLYFLAMINDRIDDVSPDLNKTFQVIPFP